MLNAKTIGLSEWKLTTLSYIMLFIAINTIAIAQGNIFFLLLYVILKTENSFPTQNRPFKNDNNSLIIVDWPKAINVIITTMISICVW